MAAHHWIAIVARVDHALGAAAVAPTVEGGATVTGGAVTGGDVVAAGGAVTGSAGTVDATGAIVVGGAVGVETVALATVARTG